MISETQSGEAFEIFTFFLHGGEFIVCGIRTHTIVAFSVCASVSRHCNRSVAFCVATTLGR
jgi:hypothetical protein